MSSCGCLHADNYCSYDLTKYDSACFIQAWELINSLTEEFDIAAFGLFRRKTNTDRNLFILCSV